MTRAEFESMGFEDIMASVEHDCITSYETLKEFAKNYIESDDLNVAIHILEAINDNPAEWYEYDYCMGTLQTPSPVTCKEDIEHLIVD